MIYISGYMHTLVRFHLRSRMRKFFIFQVVLFRLNLAANLGKSIFQLFSIKLKLNTSINHLREESNKMSTFDLKMALQQKRNDCCARSQWPHA